MRRIEVRRAAGPLALALAAAIACSKSTPSKPAQGPVPTPPTEAGGRKVLYWYDPMVPGSKFDKPGKSPFMDMQLVAKYADEAPGEKGPSAAVALSPQAVRVAGVATAPVLRERLASEVRTVGTIEADETRLVRVAARVAGRIEKLHADFTGQAVRAGAPLFALYSPELVATQRELILALDNRGRLASATAEAMRAADELVASSRERLRLWGIRPSEIAALEASRQPRLSLTFASPISGTVLEKKVVEGQYVTEGTDLYLLADLSSVWLVAQVYEYELARLSIGQAVTASVTAFPARSFRGRIAFIEPTLDRETRTARVRIELPNPRGDLKPGMFAEAVLKVPAAEALTVPKSAVLDTGVRRVVWVETEPNTFSPRDVRVGAGTRDRVAVLEGLKEGERVVAAAGFFIDSQAQLSGGASIQWSGALDVKTTPTPGGRP